MPVPGTRAATRGASRAHSVSNGPNWVEYRWITAVRPRLQTSIAAISPAPISIGM
jgi:hypothetical protein